MKLIRTLVLSLIFLTACGGSSGGDSANSCGSLNLRISNGDSCSLNSTPVVFILTQDSNGNVSSCTGTFVSLTSVLTAAHCIPPGTVDIAVFTENNTFSLSNGGLIDLDIHPLYINIAPQVGDVLLFDFAMLRTNRAADVNPVPLIRSESIGEGQLLTVLGFGADESGNNFFERDPDDLLRAGEVQITDARNGIFRADFNLTGQSTCVGDSGGPVLKSLDDGTTGLVGVTSFGTNSGCTTNSFTWYGNLQYEPIYSWVEAFAPDVAVR